MHYNNFDEVVEQKYKEINQVRLEYPHIVQTFKSARFPADIIKSLSMALDDFGEHPLIVRSSSLLEDRMGAAFSGKYKSLFLANQGSKQERLDALMDAIAEVYASTFSPDPIEYRAERGLIDFGEEMGIMIQEVVGRRVGKYFLPAYAGVAFSNNEFRWSPRIKRKDGLVRIVPGLGTRAVDRLSDDFPILIAPGQPNLRVNVTADEVCRYSPQMIDVINLETNKFETLEVGEFLKEVGYELPAINKMVSIFKDNHLQRPMGMNIDFDSDDLVVSFEGLIEQTPFVKQMHRILQTLEKTIGTPIDVEFASDGKDLYLLQCRPQSYSAQDYAPPIPKDLPKDQIIFSANKYISNGLVADITHLVYVDPKSYGELTTPSAMVEIGRAVSRLNKLLPKRKFILMGPGRWGSRGDIKLGVSVTYSDINNCAALIEIARKKGNYVPDLSFGTHFFQDLVEANIRYLPLYPDDEGITFNEYFLTRRQNILKEVVPEYAHLSDTIRLIDLPLSTSGLVLQILMNADLEEAVAILTKPGEELEMPNATTERPGVRRVSDYWRWRMQMAERIALGIDPDRFGVKGVYLIGSTKNASATPSSDINLLIHFQGDGRQRDELNTWLDGWSKALAEINYMRTGYRTDGLLDVRLISDSDISEHKGHAAKINAATDPAMQLPMKMKQ
jgi:predicted nucleotidyltransferase